ncbi:hypothetical protein [Bradyrhizobium sp.]|uniref:hypothetical protein n=1 Tax=Bradyrhizobium sp. TaxID=376 RepID=UPI003C66AF03
MKTASPRLSVPGNQYAGNLAFVPESRPATVNAARGANKAAVVTFSRGSRIAADNKETTRPQLFGLIGVPDTRWPVRSMPDLRNSDEENQG